MEYFQNEKQRKDFISGKTQKYSPPSNNDNNIPQTALINALQRRNKKNCFVSSEISATNLNNETQMCLSSCNGFLSPKLLERSPKHQNNKALSPSFAAQMYVNEQKAFGSSKLVDSPKFLDSTKTQTTINNQIAKILVSPKLKKIFQEQREKIPLIKGVEEVKQQPIKMTKNNKNLIFFKNKVIQIEKNLLKEEEKVIVKNQPTLAEIFNQGSTPTKFFIKRKNAKSTSTYVSSK